MIDVVRQILCRLEPGLCVCTAGSRIITSFGDASKLASLEGQGHGVLRKGMRCCGEWAD